MGTHKQKRISRTRTVSRLKQSQNSLEQKDSTGNQFNVYLYPSNQEIVKHIKIALLFVIWYLSMKNVKIFLFAQNASSRCKAPDAFCAAEHGHSVFNINV